MRIVERVWIDHILFAHPELNSQLEAVVATLTEPDIVRYDMYRPDAECYYRRGAIEHVPHHYLKVVVRFIADEDGIGYVNTSYISRNVREREALKWPT